MNYLLDSSIVSDFYNFSAPAHKLILNKLSLFEDTDRVYVSVLCLYELAYGLANAPEDKKLLIREQLIKTPQDFELLPLFLEAAELFGQLKKSLQSHHALSARQMQRHNIDLMLAATAITTDSILISTDKGFVALQDLHPDFHFEEWLIINDQ